MLMNQYYQLECSKYLDIDIDLREPRFSSSDVFLLSIKKCSASTLPSSPSSPLSNLSVTLSSSSESDAVFTPTTETITADEYTFALTTAHGFINGRYTLRIECVYTAVALPLTEGSADDSESASSLLVSVMHQIKSSIPSSIPMLENKLYTNQLLIGSIDTFQYYRYTSKRIDKDINIRLSLILSSSHVLSSNEYTEIYVSNKYDGLLPCTRNEYIWSGVCTSTSPVVINISKDDDSIASYGRCFVIGVISNHYCRTIDYQLSVCEADDNYPTHVAISTACGSSNDIELTANTYHYFSIDTTAISAADDGASTDEVMLFILSPYGSQQLNQDEGTLIKYANNIISSHNYSMYGIYTVDTLTSQSTSTPNRAHLHPVVYLTNAESTCRYPTSSVYDCKATSDDGCVMLVVDKSHCSIAGRINLAVTARKINHSDTSSYNESIVYTLQSSIIRRYKYDKKYQYNHSIFNSIYSSVDGTYLSSRSRLKHSVDDDSMVYSEVEYTSFISIMNQSVNLPDGLTFYCIGCGTGKALIAAALSDRRFKRCIGIEAVKELAQCAKDCSKKLQKTLKQQQQQQLQQQQHKVNKHHHHQLLSSLPLIEVRHEDIVASSINDADIIYMHSLCYDEQLLQSILTTHLIPMKEGTVLIVTKVIETYHKYFTCTAISQGYLTCRAIGMISIYTYVRRGSR